MSIKVLSDNIFERHSLVVPEFAADCFTTAPETPSGRYQIYLKIDENPLIEIGYFSIKKFLVNVANYPGLNPPEILDELSKGWDELGSLIPTESWEETDIPHILYLESLCIYSKFRSRNYGMNALTAILFAGLKKLDVAAILSFPTDDNDCIDSSKEQDNKPYEQEKKPQ